jgi:hypothetical protein
VHGSGSVVARYVFKLSFNEKSYNCNKLNNHRSWEKNKQRFGILRLFKINDTFLTKLRNTKTLHNKTIHRLLETTKIRLGEISSLVNGIGAVIEQYTHDPKFQGSNPPPLAQGHNVMKPFMSVI